MTGGDAGRRGEERHVRVAALRRRQPVRWLQVRPSGDQPHVGIAGVTLHKTRPISILDDTNGCSFRLGPRLFRLTHLPHPGPVLLQS